MLDNSERKKILIALIAVVVISSALLFYLSRPTTSPTTEISEENTIIVPEPGVNGLPAGIKIPEIVRVNTVNREDTISSNGNVVIEKEYGLPINIKIPVIGVDAVVESVGITETGEMGIPKGPSEVGWYELGMRPGEEGSAVMAGHYGTWRSGQGSVFDNLYKLRAGDEIYVEDDKGEKITFVVSKTREYDPKADTSDIFISSDGKAHLNLITCEGNWNKASQSFSQRRVVFADKE
jgi:LPXTG-site transpeptidase (sortase) family protein